MAWSVLSCQISNKNFESFFFGNSKLRIKASQSVVQMRGAMLDMFTVTKPYYSFLQCLSFFLSFFLSFLGGGQSRA